MRKCLERLFLILLTFVLFSGFSEKKLISNDEESRFFALNELNNLDYETRKNVLSFLIEKLEDGQWEVRWKAAEALGMLSDKTAVESLMKHLNDDDLFVKEKVIEALGMIGDKSALSNLLNMINDPDPKIREKIVWVLGMMPDDSVVNALIQLLADDSMEVRNQAMEALVKLRAIDGEHLVKAITAKNWNIRWSAEIILIKIGKPVIPVLKNSFESCSYYCKWRIAKIVKEIAGADAAKDLFKALGTENEIREKAIFSLDIESDSKSKDIIMAAVVSKDNMLKIRAVETAGLTVCKDVVFLLVPLIYNKNSDLRYEAAIALERIGWTPGSMKEKIYFYSAKKAWGEVAKLGEPAIEMLSIMLANDDDSIRIIAVEAFGELKTRKAANKIIECLKDKNKDIRVKAAEALGKIATIDVVEPLNRTLSSSDKELVLTSIEAVGKIKDVRSVNPLILLLANDDEAITDAATKSLVSIGIQGVGILKIKLTDPNPKIRLGVAEVLNQLGQKNLVAKYEKDNIAITKDSEVPVQPVMPVVAAPLTPDTAVKPAVPVVSDVPDSMPSSIRPVTPIVVPPIIPMPSSITPSAAPVTTASTPVTPVTPAVVAPVVPPIVSKEPVVPFQETVLSKDEYKNLIKDLLGNDKVKRISAAKKLGDIKERRALDPLIEVLDKSMSDKNFVSVLIDALTNIGDPKAVKGVSNFIGDSDLTVRSKAIGFLVGMGNFSINAISTKLKSNDVNVRTGAMDVLEKIGDKDSVLLLITALDDPDIKIAVRAVKMIGKLKEARAINTMILKLYTNNDELRTELENVLVGFGQVIVPLIKPMLEDSNPAVQRSAMRIYELLNTKNVKKMQFEEPGSYTSLIRDLKDPEITVRLAAVNELKILKIEKAVDPLQSAFESADSTDELQIAILDALMAINTQKAIEAICQALASEYSNVSAKAEIMILQIGEPAIMPLYKTSKTVSPSVRIKIVSVLSKMNMAKIIDYLSTFVKDKDSEVVMKTINVLSKTKDIKAVNAIILVLYSSDKELRSASQDALISMGEIVVDPLIEKLNDKNPNMFYGAARVLEAINIKRGLDAIREAEGRKEIDMFLVDLKSKDEQARSKAAEAIGNHKGKRAVDSLLSVINDPSEEVQIKAIEALGKIGDERSVDAIITKLFSENKDITDVSEKALIQIGEPSVKHLVDNIKNEKISDSIKHILEMMNTP